MMCYYLNVQFQRQRVKMSMEQRWNDKDRVKQKYSDENLPHCNIVHHKSHMD
jgi:hypothetical protein